MSEHNAACTHLALFTSSLAGGGAQRAMRNLAVALAAEGFRVDLVVCEHNATATTDLDEAGVHLVILPISAPGVGRALALRAEPHAWRILARPVLLPLKTWTKLRHLAGLTAYLRRERPDVLLSALTKCNVLSLWARRLAGVSTRIAVSERNTLSSLVRHNRRKWRARYMPRLVAHIYPQADTVIAVSTAVADDLAAATRLPRERIEIAPNAVVDATLQAGARAPLSHPWLAADTTTPVILSAGRLTDQKDPETLVRGFALLRAKQPARLVLLGAGPLHDKLARLARELGIAADVELAGWTDNPFAYMARANVFVLPSLWEGLPGVLIQAMACGCPVVATDCPGGSAEILDHGRFGTLVPMRDPTALSNAMIEMLDAPTDAALIVQRADEYSSKRAARCYIDLLLNRP